MSDQYIPWWIPPDHPARDPEGRAKAEADAHQEMFGELNTAIKRASEAEERSGKLEKDQAELARKLVEAERRLAEATKPIAPPAPNPPATPPMVATQTVVKP